MNPSRRTKEVVPRPKLGCSSQGRRTMRRVPGPSGGVGQARGELRTAARAIQELNDVALEQAFQGKDLHGALRVLHQVEAAISDCPYEGNRRLQQLHLAVFHNNKAFILEELEHDEESCRMMERSVRAYEQLLGVLLTHEEQVAHGTAFLRLSLRYCALLSHAERHLEAIAVAERALQKIAELLSLLEALSNEGVDSARGTPETVATQSESRMKSAERVDFKRIVVRQARRLLGEVEVPLPGRLVSEQREAFEQKMNMYFWRSNADNNARTIRKELHSRDSERNLLGLQKSSSFLEEFSLSDLMSLDLLKLAAKLNTDAYYLLSAPKIVELVLFAAVCYFTIATETRFSEGSLEAASLKISEKYKRLNKDEAIARCKVLHLKAIELAGKHLPADNDFFVHLLNSFNKNYKCLMDEIKEESEISLKDINHEINETYYHRLDDTSKFEDPASNKKKKRSVSKEKPLTGLKKKRTNSISKKV